MWYLVSLKPSSFGTFFSTALKSTASSTSKVSGKIHINNNWTNAEAIGTAMKTPYGVTSTGMTGVADLAKEGSTDCETTGVSGK